MAIVSKVGRRGQLTLPSAVRRLLMLEEGDRVAFVRQGEAIVLQRLPLSLRDVRGSVGVAGPQDFDAVRSAVEAEHARLVVEDAENA